MTTFNYDSRDMLVEEKYLRWDAENSNWKVMYWARYKYDTAGNMVERHVSQIANSVEYEYIDNGFIYSRGYQLTEFTRTEVATSQARVFSLTYDDNGNLTSIVQDPAYSGSFYDITPMEFQYDKKNRLIGYRFGESEYWGGVKYDALGRARLHWPAMDSAVERKEYYDGRQEIQEVLYGSDDVLFDLLRGPVGIMRHWDALGEKRSFYITDPLGTIWAIVDPTTMGVKHYNYNAWGEHLDASDPYFPPSDPYLTMMRYIGSRVEAFAKPDEHKYAIYRLDHRHYLPVLGRFLQMYPESGGYMSVSPYNYSNNDPTNSSDASGLFRCSAFCKCCEMHDNLNQLFLGDLNLFNIKLVPFDLLNYIKSFGLSNLPLEWLTKLFNILGSYNGSLRDINATLRLWHNNNYALRDDYSYVNIHSSINESLGLWYGFGGGETGGGGASSGFGPEIPPWLRRLLLRLLRWLLRWLLYMMWLWASQPTPAPEPQPGPIPRRPPPPNPYGEPGCWEGCRDAWLIGIGAVPPNKYNCANACTQACYIECVDSPDDYSVGYNFMSNCLKKCR